MVWAVFTHRHKTQLVFLDYSRGRDRGLNAQRYVDHVLQLFVWASTYCPATEQRPAPCCKVHLKLPGGQHCPNIAMAGDVAGYEPNRTRLVLHET